MPTTTPSWEPGPRRAPASIFSSLELEWRQLARSAGARGQVQRWALAETALGPLARTWPWGAPIVRWAGYRPLGNGGAVLSALLRLAQEPLAARALLQAMAERLRREKLTLPTYGHVLGERRGQLADTYADLVAECFAAIVRHAGQERHAVDRLLVGEATRRLRTARQVQHRFEQRTCPLADAPVAGRPAIGPVVELEAARTLAERFLVVIMQAVRAGQITPGQAGLVYGARAQGLAASEAGRRLGLAPGAVYYALAQAERALGRAVA